jgi:hypothetical protein
MRDVSDQLLQFDHTLTLWELCDAILHGEMTARNAALAALTPPSPDEHRIRSESSQRRRVYGSWLTICARDATITIREFGLALSESRNLAERCPVLRSHVDRKTLSDVTRDFHQRFAGLDFMRARAAHRVDTGSWRRRNSVRGGRFTYMAGRTVGASVAGEERQLVIDRSTFRALAELKDRLYACLRDVEAALKIAHREGRTLESRAAGAAT